MIKQKKYYTVRHGKKIGVFGSRNECKRSVQGFPGAKYKSFTDRKIAEQALAEDYENHITKKPKTNIFGENIPFIKNSISVDAACSGNPGVMEYRGVELQQGKEIFKEKFNSGTNNIGEFLALVHGIAYLKTKKLPNMPIYSDSRIAMNRVLKKKCKTKFEISEETVELFKVIKRAETRLKNNTFQNKILKRDTKNRGEIPADFGRK